MAGNNNTETETDDDNMQACMDDQVTSEEEENNESDAEDDDIRPFVKRDRAHLQMLLSNLPKKRQRTKKQSTVGKKVANVPTKSVAELRKAYGVVSDLRN